LIDAEIHLKLKCGSAASYLEEKNCSILLINHRRLILNST